MSRIISIHSYRGGTGKSNLVANIAATVARYGYRVGIVDTDIQSPGVHVIFGFDEQNLERSLNDYLWGRCALQDSAYDVTRVLGSASQPKSKLFLVPSSVKTGEISRVIREGYDVELLNDGFQDLIDALELDYLFIDTHPGLNEETLASLTISDVLLVVLRPDQQDYQGTAVTLDIARELEVPKQLLVVNKVPALLETQELKAKLEATYHSDVAGVIPHSDELMLLASAGIFSLRYPDHRVTQIIDTITRQVMF